MYSNINNKIDPRNIFFLNMFCLDSFHFECNVSTRNIIYPQYYPITSLPVSDPIFNLV